MQCRDRIEVCRANNFEARSKKKNTFGWMKQRLVQFSVCIRNRCEQRMVTEWAQRCHPGCCTEEMV